MKTYCFALDLHDDPVLIAEYEYWHKAENGWPEVTKSLTDAGVINMSIYRTGNRLFMLMITNDEFSIVTKSALDKKNSKVMEWEQLMWKFQKPLPWAKEGEKWVLMQEIFHL